MKKHKSSHLAPSNNHLILNLLTAAMCILVCSNHLSLPSSSLEPYMNHFLSITLPHIKSTFLHPKCLFIVVNAIVVFLIGESRLRALPSSPADDLYVEYIDRISRGNKGFKVHDAVPQKKNDKGRDSKKDFVKEDRRVEEVGAEGTRKLVEKDKDEEELPAEELNRRVEAFIARVNKRRSLEAADL